MKMFMTQGHWLLLLPSTATEPDLRKLLPRLKYQPLQVSATHRLTTLGRM